MSHGRRHCDVIRSSWRLDLRHSGVSGCNEAYRVIGLLRGPRHQWRHDSGVAASAPRVDGFVAHSEVHTLGKQHHGSRQRHPLRNRTAASGGVRRR
ncbi:hypothetical protein NDU88_007588 [Pleurodeles waltl]|uniref:Uncharacterized protein n=1 Tax=Pleurodeles waltl TaxID=8319 RepID=A0AAV7U0X2_PLEWA|nr:hypothetical protein NDU88_007588 [Pleurodeles waltl]